MNIKNEDLQLLIQIENFLGTNFPRGSEGQDLAWKLCSLNERLIMQRNEQRGKTVYENLQMLCKGCNAGKSDCAPIEE